MKISKIVDLETEDYQFVNSAQIDRGEFTTHLFCGFRIEDIQPACLSDDRAEAARVRMIDTTLSRIADHERKSGCDKYPRVGSECEAERNMAWGLTVALGIAIERSPGTFWLVNRNQHYSLEEVLNKWFIDEFGYACPGWFDHEFAPDSMP